MVNRFAQCKIFTDSRKFSQARERYRHARRFRESYFRHEIGDKKHERRVEHGDLTGNDTNSFEHDHSQRTREGI